MAESAKDHREPDMVYSITSAKQAHSDELAGREKRYAISMTIRTVCFVLGVICWLNVAVWLGVVFMLGATILPYTSVILANAGVRRSAQNAHLMDQRSIESKRPDVDSEADSPEADHPESDPESDPGT